MDETNNSSESDDIVAATNSLSSKNRAEWNDRTTKLLIDLYKKHSQSVGKNKAFRTYNKLWHFISKQMVDHHYFFTPSQIKQKWDALTRAYKIKKNKPQTVRRNKAFPYQKDLDEIYVRKRNKYLEFIEEDSDQWDCLETSESTIVDTTEYAQIPATNTRTSSRSKVKPGLKKKKLMNLQINQLRQCLTKQHKQKMEAWNKYQKKKIELKKYYEEQKHKDRLLLIETIKNINKKK